jgi:hypothetical protein
MGFLGRLGCVLAVGAVVMLVAGCGGTTVDSQSLEETISAYLQKSLHENVKSVSCPSDQPVDPGLIVKCDVTLKDGTEKVAAIEITNKDADIRVAHYGGSNE